jgi:acyl carrier protein
MTIELKVKEVLERVLLPADDAAITSSADLREDLDADSLDIVEIQIELEEMGLEITDTAAECWRTVQDVIDTAAAAEKATTH